MPNDPEVERILERVAQQVVYCNCATEGPALKRCEHLGVLAVLRRELGPLLESGKTMREQMIGDAEEGAIWSLVVHGKNWDAAWLAALGEK